MGRSVPSSISREMTAPTPHTGAKRNVLRHSKTFGLSPFPKGKYLLYKVKTSVLETLSEVTEANPLPVEDNNYLKKQHKLSRYVEDHQVPAPNGSQVSSLVHRLYPDFVEPRRVQL